MSIKSRYRNNSTVFDHWVVGEQIGSGSNGRTAVFRVRHRESAQEESALKVITLIKEDGQYERFSDSRRQEYDKEMNRRKDIALEEVKLLNTLKGHTNIVSYEDRVTKPWDSDDAFGVDLLIRMELLQDLRKKINSSVVFPESEIIKIGKDICNALMLCHCKNILHRDIKPENIFVNKYGDYKLGDFGVSRILKDCPGAKASTGIGTPEYVAPEQGSGSYDKRVDIYSLGLVLYELSNGNRLPFATSSYVKEVDIQRRLAAKELPKPAHASAELVKVILKACALKPEDRYQTAKEMADALNGITPIRKKTAPENPQRAESEKKKAQPYKTEPAKPRKPDSKKTNGKSYATKPATPKEAKDSEMPVFGMILPVFGDLLLMFVLSNDVGLGLGPNKPSFWIIFILLTVIILGIEKLFSIRYADVLLGAAIFWGGGGFLLGSLASGSGCPVWITLLFVVAVCIRNAIPFAMEYKEGWRSIVMLAVLCLVAYVLLYLVGLGMVWLGHITGIKWLQFSN